MEGCDNYFRRRIANSLTPLVREMGVIAHYSVTVFDTLALQLSNFQPDVIVHLAEIPSAPYSMQSPLDAMTTQGNNVVGSLSVLLAVHHICPDAHLLKLGSMGEYIPSSWYHMSKVLDTDNCKYACRQLGMKITDVMQGPVYGVGGRFDCDEVWGTVINRWVAMGAVKHPLLLYGTGEQIRGFLPVEDSIKCFEIAINNPPEAGEYRRINQYAIKHKLIDLADTIARVTGTTVEHIENPRQEDMHYEGDPGVGWLHDHGYVPSDDTERVVRALVESIAPYKEGIDKNSFFPKVRWNHGR